MMHADSRNRNKLYLTLSNESTKMASTLFRMNNMLYNLY